MTKPVIQVLREAKYALIDKGWFQGAFVDTYHDLEVTGYEPKGCMCILGAINFAANGDARDITESLKNARPIEEAISRRIAANPKIVDTYSGPDKEEPCWPPSYNDATDRTVEEVLSLFDEAIDIQKEWDNAEG